MFWRRRLPHWIPQNAIVFVTWRLARTYPQPPPGCAFLDQDRQFDRTRTGPQWLKDPRIAEIVQRAILHGEESRRAYDLFGWVIMPNHAHIVLHPQHKLADIVKWLKATTAHRANEILVRTGQKFWQREYYDHWLRDRRELESTITYVETNPVDAGLVANLKNWPWSSATHTGDQIRNGRGVAGVTA
jgi:REP element-mobilizing transposase RayT